MANLGNKYTEASAQISECGVYRYELTREWETTKRPKRVAFIMLNPSTADGTKDDPTVRRCVSFAKRLGGAGLVVYNLFAYRTESPAELKAKAFDTDILGPDLWRWIEVGLSLSDVIVYGWGTSGKLLSQDAEMLRFVRSLGRLGVCLGVNADGTPKHPLYIKGTQKLIPYRKV